MEMLFDSRSNCTGEFDEILTIIHLSKRIPSVHQRSIMNTLKFYQIHFILIDKTHLVWHKNCLTNCIVSFLIW